MRKYLMPFGLAAAAMLLFLPQAMVVVTAQPNDQGLVIELDNGFIDTYANRATITSEYRIAGISAVHPPKNDGEAHIGGWASEAGLPCVAEVMNVAHAGKKPLTVFRTALASNEKVTVTGAWRLWGEHAGTGPQIQALGTTPSFPLPGEFESNPDHVFEIHPVTKVKLGGQVTEATDAIGETPGFTPHDAQKAFVLGYEKLTCKIIPKGGRTRIVTEPLGFNFTEFVIRLNEDPVKLQDGHAAICAVQDTDGELLVKSRRMVFPEGTDADSQVQSLKKGKRLKVIGIPRVSLKLIKWRLDHKDDAGWDISPLEWRLPYEMIIIAATPLADGGD